MNQAKTSRSLQPRLTTLLMLVLAGFLLAPIAVYIFGVNLFAPYEGDGGLPGFLGSVYGDALRGEPAAWALLLTPAAFVITWWAVFRLIRSGRAPAKAGN